MTENKNQLAPQGAEIHGTVKSFDVDIVIRGADGQIRERRTEVIKMEV